MEPGNKVEVPHRHDRRKKSPGVSASIGGENRLRSNLPRSAYKIARCDTGFGIVTHAFDIDIDIDIRYTKLYYLNTKSEKKN